ncbi:MAG: PhoH family protein [Candidatus Saccharibacteria bacterium]|nr:PhoH family protein [Candidatus Saccharibacteria bacterium]
MKKVKYVVDTNILVEYPDIIPNGAEVILDHPTIDLSQAHLVVPTAVIRELSEIEKAHTKRGQTARRVLRNLKNLFRYEQDLTMENFYSFDAPPIRHHQQSFYLLPIPKNFSKDLPFSSQTDDFDEQIILAALYLKSTTDSSPIILTNNSSLALRATACGIKTSGFGYRHYLYTGRRDLVVPEELYQEFINQRRLSLHQWQSAMPNQPKLIANEFIIMQTKNPSADIDNRFFANIGRFDVNTQEIVALKYVSNFPIRIENPGQAIYVEALMEPSIAAVICTGPAGSGKTYLASIYGYLSCNDGDYLNVAVVPCKVSNDGIGYLPGDLAQKLDPSVQPIKNALRNYFLENKKEFRNEFRNKSIKESFFEDGRSLKQRLNDLVEQTWKNWFDSIPIAYARGRDFSRELALYDEFQDQEKKEANTLIKRIGKKGKIIITGDIEQIHAPYLNKDNNGLVYVQELLKDSPLVAQIRFTDQEVVRHELVELIVQREQEFLAGN